MGDVVSINQSPYIRGRNIHDNFILVQEVAINLHRRKSKGVIAKLDISRAFDLLSWSFLLEVLRAKGFSEHWCSRLTTLLSTASSRVLVNGSLGKKFRHAKGLRKGDLVSPLLFVIAMDELTTMESAIVGSDQCHASYDTDCKTKPLLATSALKRKTRLTTFCSTASLPGKFVAVVLSEPGSTSAW
ncbi:hypothetical protein D1007_45266 [Hordeum vulgare]|nr:hypothetical protein D1007_45266 [Hordeum vulgare]